jgi:hypothetical protein
MGRRPYKNRIIEEMQTRDVVEDFQPELKPEPKQERSFDNVPIVRCMRPVCPACGHSTWRNGGSSRPNIPTGEILRWRRCAHCGRSQYHAYPMTEIERKQYTVA